MDEGIATFYSKGNQAPCLGSDEFRAWAYQQRQMDDNEVSKSSLQQFRPNIDEVMTSVAKGFGVELLTLTESQRGRREGNVPRWVVMHLGQELCGLSLRQIADRLGLKRT